MQPEREHAVADTATELARLGIRLREIALDGGFRPTPTNAALAGLGATAVFIAGRQEQASRHARRRLARFRTGAEGESVISSQTPVTGWTAAASTATKANRSGLVDGLCRVCSWPDLTAWLAVSLLGLMTVR
jgi:hypothetical protein